MLSRFMETYVNMDHPSIYKDSPEVIFEESSSFVEGKLYRKVKGDVDTECELSLAFRMNLETHGLSCVFSMEKGNCFHKEEKAIENENEMMGMFHHFTRVAVGYVDFLKKHDDDITIEGVFYLINKQY